MFLFSDSTSQITFVLVFERGTWGCTAFLCAVSSSFSPRTQSADESSISPDQSNLSMRSGLICHIFSPKNFVKFDAKIPAERRVVSLDLPNNHNLRRETKGFRGFVDV